VATNKEYNKFKITDQFLLNDLFKTLNVWGVRIDEAFFLGGSEKYEILEAFGADIFFDDQDVHLELSKGVVPSAKVIHQSIEDFK